MAPPSNQRIRGKAPVPYRAPATTRPFGQFSANGGARLPKRSDLLLHGDETVPRPVRDAQLVRDVVYRVVVAGHRGRVCPSEVVVQHSSESLVGREAGVDERLIEASDRSTIHLV